MRSPRASKGTKRMKMTFHTRNPLDLPGEIASEIVLEALCGKSSPLFKRLLDEELIDMGFGSEMFNGFGFSCVMLGGTSADPEKTAGIIKAEIAKAQMGRSFRYPDMLCRGVLFCF